MDYGHIKKRDSGYVITKNGLPYWVPREDKEWESVQEYATAHPECVTEEQPYVPPVPTTEELAASVRAERDKRITATDYLVMPDYPLDTDKLEEIKAYRQALRDIPQQPGFPWNGPDDPACPWPVIPTLNR
nr:MAG TPA: tail assembly chaperone protein [Caudoviricetes sp.]